MFRNYNLINNPFFDGLRHKSIEITDKTCGSKENNLVYLLTNFRNEMTKHSNHVPLNRKETIAYYAGRTIRFPISVIGTIVDALLQLFICFTITIEFAVFKGVAWLKDDLNRSQKMNIFKRISFFSRLLGCIQYSTTRQEPIFLAKDLRWIPDCKLPYDLSERLIKYLYQTTIREPILSLTQK